MFTDIAMLSSRSEAGLSTPKRYRQHRKAMQHNVGELRSPNGAAPNSKFWRNVQFLRMDVVVMELMLASGGLTGAQDGCTAINYASFGFKVEDPTSLQVS